MQARHLNGTSLHMTLELRPYQKRAVGRTLVHFRSSSAPACLVLPTGAGKSLIIAELCRLARGRVLVLAHVKELCEQNHEKFSMLGGQAGLFSAGLGRKESTDRVVFASIQSVAQNLAAFAREHSLLIVDECHRVSEDADSQYLRVIRSLQEVNPCLKILGLTATPYRMTMGWIYRVHHSGAVRSDEPRPFEICVDEVTLRELIGGNYLTPPHVVDAPIAHYEFALAEVESSAALQTMSTTGARETSSSEKGSTAARWEALDDTGLDAHLAKHPRVTAAITAQILELAEAQKRKGVMIFAATVRHAQEITGYLPESFTGLVVGTMPAEERRRIIDRFRAQELRYLVNVSVLTTGFDAPHVDFIALLRPTESVGLFQQMIGRGLRLFPGKRDCLVIDYAGTGFDLFHPEVGERKPESSAVPVEVECPECGFSCSFWGLFDEEGRVVEHYGRRCQGSSVAPTGERVRCTYRFRFKECARCTQENDIAARSCQNCNHSLVDPDEQLRDALRLKDARVLRVAGMTFQASDSKLTVTYHDEEGSTLREWFDFSHGGQRGVFNRVFGRRIASGRRPLALEHAEQAVALQAHIPAPDFVIARRRGRYFRIQGRLFDYVGQFRQANSL